MSPSVEFKSKIRTDKFFPPQVDTPQFLYRQRIVETLLQQSVTGKDHIIMVAQPGLGKTTVIKQYLDRVDTASAWYRVGSEDADPGFFLQAIQACISGLLPEFPSASTTRALSSGALTLLDLPRQLDLLVHDLKLSMKEDLFLVFDDLHHLLSHPTSLFILNYLLASTPAKLHFILISRERLSGLEHLDYAQNLLRLDSHSIVMEENEIIDYFHQILHLAVPLNLIREVTRLTEGWIMGVRLLGLHLEQHRGQSSVPVLIDGKTLGHWQIFQYFGQEIFSLLEEATHRSLLVLSLLDEIPIELATQLTRKHDIKAVLTNLVRRNIFIRSLNPEYTKFGLHHLFQQFLREKARETLDEETIVWVNRQAGDFYRNSGNPDQALLYFLQAQDYEQIEATVQDTGMRFLASNQAATLTTILSQIPEDRLQEMGWASLFLALAHMDSTPTLALPLLERSLALFSLQNNEIGELLSLTHSISIRIVTTGHFQGGEALLHRAVLLFSQVADALDISTTILVASNLAMGYCIFLADVDEATRYASLALMLARKEQLVNFEAALLITMGYIRIFAGHTTLSRMYLEQAAPLVHHSEVGAFNRLAIRMMLFNFLFHEGDFKNYFDQKQQAVNIFGVGLISQSIAGPFCYIWEMDIALNQGNYAAALEIADQALVQHPPFSPHLTSQILQLKGVVLAIQGKHDQALTAADESRQLRELAGGRYFITLNNLLVGLVYALCGHHEKGLVQLDQGIEDARRMPTEYLEACGLLHRADVLLMTGQADRAQQDIEAGMRLLRRNAYRHFWAWTQGAMARILSAAAYNGIEPHYSRELAAGRIHLALLEDSTAIPLLDIQTLGGFRILHKGTTLLDAESMTPLQRELLALLIAAPGLKIPQETLCLHFWPDSPQAAVKIKFDTLVSRLRKIFAEVLPEQTASLYLNREKGMLWLAHCRIDAYQFLDGIKQGMIHYRLQEFWQAGNIFTAAEPLWLGEFAPGVTGDDGIRIFRDTLVRSLTKLAFAWSDLLVASNRLPAAIGIIEKALMFDQLNDRLYALLYQLEGRNSALHSRRVLKRFETILRQEGYHPHEISDLVAAITTPPTPVAALFST